MLEDAVELVLGSPSADDDDLPGGGGAEEEEERGDGVDGAERVDFVLSDY